MFIYEFMGGIVNTITEDENGESYDPHVHRKVQKPTSYADTMIHLLKGSIGAGILAMPDAFSRVGVMGGVIGMATVGTVATYCVHLLINAQYILCKRHRTGYMSYAKSMKVAIETGPECMRKYAVFLSCFVDTVLVVWQLGLCCVYIVFVASNIKQVMDYHRAVFSIRTHICFIFIPLTLCNMVMDLKLLTPLSTISNIMTIFGLLLVFFYLIEDDVEMDPEMIIGITNEETMYTVISGIPVFIGMTLFALEAVGVVLALEYNMENPKDFSGICGLFNVGMVIIVALYTVVGVFGFLKYGSTVRASITLNLPENEKKAQAAKLIIAVAIFLTYPLQNFVTYSILWSHIKLKLAANKQRCADFTLRFCLIVIAWSFAVMIPQLGPFISLFGALCLSLLALVFPAILDICTRQSIGYGTLNYIFFRDVVLAIIGITCLVAGCYTSVLEIFAESHN